VADAVSALGWFACGVGLSSILITWFLHDIQYWLALCHLAAGALALCGLMVPRVLAVALRESAVVAHHRRGGRSRPDSKRALLYGAGNLGELFVFWLGISRESEWSDLAVTGFIDDQPGLKGRMIRGFPVLGNLGNLPVLVERLAIDCVVLTMSVPGEGVRDQLMDAAAALGVEVLEWRPEMGLVGCVGENELVHLVPPTQGKAVS
jgi:FlaA1/EpsC-like NDP-sugar epimerase